MADFAEIRFDDLARAMGAPEYCVVDAGHAAGTRLRDYDRFDDPHDPRRAMLVECGQHFAPESVDVAVEASLRFLVACGIIDTVPTGLTPTAPQ